MSIYINPAIKVILLFLICLIVAFIIWKADEWIQNKCQKNAEKIANKHKVKEE